MGAALDGAGFVPNVTPQPLRVQLVLSLLFGMPVCLTVMSPLPRHLQSGLSLLFGVPARARAPPPAARSGAASGPPMPSPSDPRGYL